MKKKEACRKIEYIDYFLQNTTSDYGEREHEAMMMAKKALEQETCEDCVNRAEVFEQINCWIGSGEYRYTNATHYLLKRIKKLQSVNSQELKIEKDEIDNKRLRFSDTVTCKFSNCEKEFTGKFDGHNLIVDTDCDDRMKEVSK